MKVSFLGDISLNDNYIESYKKGINPFKPLLPILSTSDFVVGNLESIAKGEQGENKLKKPRLATSVETLNYLNVINLKVACLAQNHVFDHLEDGFKKTTRFLKENNIEFFGASIIKEEVDKPVIIERNNIKIGLLNYVTKDTNPNLPEDAGVFLSFFQIEKAMNDIQLLKPKVNHVVLVLHWGGRVEGGLIPDWDQPRLAHKLIDAGADLIVGHHSHTIQPYEVYNGKYIFYSIGNFCFSDYWFEGNFTPMSKRRKITFIPNITFNEASYKIKFSYYLNKIEYFEELKNYHFKHKIRNFIYITFLDIYPFWLLYYFFMKNILPAILFFERDDVSFSEKIYRLKASLRRRMR